MALFNEAESVAESVEEEVVAPTKRRGKRKPLPADLPRIDVIHELPDHELTCACGCRKHSIGEEVSEQLKIVPIANPRDQTFAHLRLSRLRNCTGYSGQARSTE